MRHRVAALAALVGLSLAPTYAGPASASREMDADGARRTLFGEEPAMDRPSPWAKAERRRNELVNRVGPWGSLNKGKRR